MGWISRALAWRLDPILMRLSGGRLRFGLLLPTALLETRGARTGALRRNCVPGLHSRALFHRCSYSQASHRPARRNTGCSS